jgi:hypothetical protein
MNLKLVADKVTVRGPKIDGSFVVNLELGEYQKNVLANLLNELDFNEVVEVTIKQNAEKSG